MPTRTEKAVRITESGDQEAIRKLRDKNTVFMVLGVEYTIKPNRCTTEPVRIFPCKFKESCNRQTRCKFYHSAEDRMLRATITVDKQYEDHIKTIIKGAVSVERGRLRDFVVFMPYTDTLMEIITSYDAYITKKLQAEGTWKTIACNREISHDIRACRYLHDGEEVAQATPAVETLEVVPEAE